MAEKAERPRIRIELTPEQQEQIRRVTGKEVPAVKLRPEALEERIAPRIDPTPL